VRDDEGVEVPAGQSTHSPTFYTMSSPSCGANTPLGKERDKTREMTVSRSKFLTSITVKFCHVRLRAVSPRNQGKG
jgi:hypothetical protein